MSEEIEAPVEAPVEAPAPVSVAEKIAPPPEVPAAADFSAKFDREGLIEHAPEGYDLDKFGKQLDKFGDPYAMAKAYAELEKFKGKGLPNENWDDADHAALNEALGVPKDADGYEFGEDIKMGEAELAGVKELANKLGLKPAQAEGVASELQEILGRGAAAEEARNEAAEENTINYLSTEWGHPQSQAYQDNFRLSQAALAHAGIEAGSDAENSILRGDPRIVALLADHARMLPSSALPGTGGGAPISTPRSLTEKMSALTTQISGMEIGSTEANAAWEKFASMSKQKERMTR